MSNVIPLRNVKESEKRGKLLTCPKCNWEWLAGHLHWDAFKCMGCKTMTDKNKWLCK